MFIVVFNDTASLNRVFLLDLFHFSETPTSFSFVQFLHVPLPLAFSLAISRDPFGSAARGYAMSLTSRLLPRGRSRGRFCKVNDRNFFYLRDYCASRSLFFSIEYNSLFLRLRHLYIYAATAAIFLYRVPSSFTCFNEFQLVTNNNNLNISGGTVLITIGCITEQSFDTSSSPFERRSFNKATTGRFLQQRKQTGA